MIVTCPECFAELVDEDGVACGDCGRTFCSDDCHGEHAAACAAEGAANA